MEQDYAVRSDLCTPAEQDSCEVAECRNDRMDYTMSDCKGEITLLKCFPSLIVLHNS